MDFQIELGEQNDWHVLPEQSPPDIGRVGLLHGRMPISTQACVIISPQALQVIDAHLLSDTYKELGGFLLGTSYQKDGRLFVEVEAALAAHSDKNGPVHFTFTADSWSMAHDEREEFYPDLNIVGWFHSHPDLGVFYSADDVTVHTTAFSSLWHVGLVVDPIRREACIFGWELASDGRCEDIIPLKGFIEFAPHTDQSAIDWRWTHGTGLGDLQRRAYTEGMRRIVGIGSNSRPSRDPVDIVGAMMQVSAITFTLSAILFLLIGFPLWQRTKSLESAVYALGDQQRVARHDGFSFSCPDDDLNILSPAPYTVLSYNERVDVIGTAVDPDARYYLLQVRKIENTLAENNWFTIDSRRFDTTGGVLGSWYSAGYDPGIYQIRVVAVYRVNGSRDFWPNTRGACQLRVTIPEPSLPPTPLPTLPTPAVLSPLLDPAAEATPSLMPDIEQVPKASDE